MEPEEFLRLVTGDLCPCGHNKGQHSDPSPDIEGEVMGACNECTCNGVIDLNEVDK